MVVVAVVEGKSIDLDNESRQTVLTEAVVVVEAEVAEVEE